MLVVGLAAATVSETYPTIYEYVWQCSISVWGVCSLDERRIIRRFSVEAVAICIQVGIPPSERMFL